jgi:hypothetical protein
LNSTDATRVAQANKIYDFVAKFASEADDAGVFFWIENPKRSWMWEIEGFKALAAKPGVHMHSLQLCMFGGTRPKWSAFLTNIPAFAGIVKTCDGSHSHAPWQSFDTPGGRVFDTASEAEYPPELCHHLAKLVLDLAVERGLEPPPTRHENKEKAPTHWCRWLHHTYPLWQADLCRLQWCRLPGRGDERRA